MTIIADDNSPIRLDLRSLASGAIYRHPGIFRWSDRDAVTLKRAAGYLRYMRREANGKRKAGTKP